MANRPTQLSRPIIFILVFLLALSFLTGLGLWYVHEQRETLGELPGWTSLCQTTHGLLNPAICVLFGFLFFNHIRGGWKMAVNRKSGGTLTTLLIVLIVSGAGLYYSSDWRHTWFTIHLVAGLLLVFIVPIHWQAARRWARSLANADSSSVPLPHRKEMPARSDK